MSDPDGNQITGAYLGTSPQTIGFNDTLLPAPSTQYVLTATPYAYPHGSSPDTYVYTDVNSNPQTIQVNYSSYYVQTNFGCSFKDLSNPSTYLPSSINVPDEGTYTITYESTPGHTGDVTGRIAKITLPSGGFVAYQYSGGSNNAGFDCYNRVPTLKRTVSDNNGNTDTWTYAWSTSYAGVTVTDQLQNQTVYTFGVNGSGGFGPNEGYNQLSANYYQGSATGTPLKTVITCYNGTAYPCTSWTQQPLTQITQTDVYTSYNGNAPNQVETKFDTYGNVTEVTTHDFGPSTLLSDKIIYYGQSWNGSTGCNAYGSGYIHNTSCYTAIKNSSGTILAQTQITYSNTGHPISTSKWVSGSTWLTTTAAYNSNGTVQWSKDTAGNETSFAYTGTGGCNSLLPTSVTHPLIGAEYRTWYCNGGVLHTSEDVNLQTTTYTYDDPYWRETLVAYPDNGSTSTTYNTKATLPWSISTSTAVTTSSNLNKTTVYDGIGRETQAQLTSDPEGVDYVDTTYDSVGRKATVSNPHRSGSLSTDGTTTYSYDAVDRVTLVHQADGSQSTTTYSNNCTTVTDEAGHSRESCVDGMGRLTGVWEDPGSSPHLNYETDYAYDALSNLLTVTQKGGASSGSWRGRSFVYDGLSRLISATNPESGTLTYAYAGAGGGLCAGDPSDVCTKVAPAPNQTGTATVTTTYSYDALNRLTGKSYSDGTTSASGYVYDQSSEWGVTVQYPIGRLVLAGTDNGTIGDIKSYDKMGRVEEDWEVTPFNSGTGSWQLVYGYDLAGDLISSSDGAGHTISYQIETQGSNSSGRISGVTSTLSDGSHPPTLATSDASNGYWPDGALHKLTFGNGLTDTTVFNNRMQPCRLNLNSSSTLLSTCTDTLPSGNVQDFTNGFNSGTMDNGNMMSFTATGNQVFARTYTYDALNRLLTMADSDSVQPCTGLTWTYDAWANRTSQSNTGHTGSACYTQGSEAFPTSNQLPASSGYQYDAAGNLTYDIVHHYTYDAENRITQVDGGSTATYVYDALGRRVQKTAGGVTVNYLYDSSGHNVSEMDGNTWSRGLVYLGNSILAQYWGGSTQFEWTDQLGSTRLLTSPNQSIYDSEDFYPFGEQMSGSSGTSHKFTGKERDSESNLDKFDARYYGSSLGRFMTPDWAAKPVTVPYAHFGDPQTLNLYAYVENGPVNRVDADGHNWGVPTLQQIAAGYESEYEASIDAQIEHQQPAQTTQTQQSQPTQKPKAKQKPKPKPKPGLVVTSHLVLKNSQIAKDQTLTTDKLGVGHSDSKGNVTSASAGEQHKVDMMETYEPGKEGSASICSPACEFSAQGGGTKTDSMYVSKGDDFVLDKRFTIDNQKVQVYDIDTGQVGDYIRQVGANGSTTLTYEKDQ
jgi:RHS repeat-associated protein